MMNLKVIILAAVLSHTDIGSGTDLPLRSAPIDR